MVKKKTLSESGDSTNGSSHPVHRGRARRRSSGRRGASTSSTRGFRSRSRAGGNLHMLQDDTPNLLQDRDDVMKEKIKRMSKGELEDLCLQMVSSNPGLVFNILKSDTSQSGGFHPPSGGNIPEWCLCNCCRQMPKEEEKCVVVTKIVSHYYHFRKRCRKVNRKVVAEHFARQNITLLFIGTRNGLTRYMSVNDSFVPHFIQNNTDTLNADYYKRAVEAIEDKVDKKPRYTFTFSVDLDEGRWLYYDRK